MAHHMHPLSLLQLARTSRLLRAAVLTQDSRKLWETSLDSVPGLPPCPGDISLPYYVALVFDDHCMVCGDGESYLADYSLGVRLCDTCFENHVVQGSALFDGVPDAVRDVVLMLVPSEQTIDISGWHLEDDLSRIDPSTHVVGEWYCRPHVDAILSLMWPIPPVREVEKLVPLLRKQIEVVKQRQMIGVLLDAWNHIFDGIRQIPSATEEMHNVVQHLQNKYRAPALRSSLLPIFAHGVSHVAKALQHDPAKSLSQREREADARENWYTHTHDARLEARYRELEDVWVNLPSDILDGYDKDILPNRHDGGRLFDDVVNVEPEAARVPVDEDRVLTAHDDINELVDEYIASVLTCFSKPIPLTPKRLSKASKGSGPVLRAPSRRDSSTNVFMHAYALFRCRHPTCEAGGTTPMMFPVIHAHWREAHPDRSIWSIQGDPSDDARGALHLEWWAEGEDTVNMILDAVNLPRTTGLDKLGNFVKSRQLCCTCGDPVLYPTRGSGSGPHWESLVWHVHKQLELDAQFRVASSSRLAPDLLLWIEDHANLGECITLTSRPQATPPASTHADPYTRARVNACLSGRPERSAVVCRACSTLAAAVKLPESMGHLIRLPPSADAIVHHLRAKHGKLFQEDDLVFHV